MNRRQIICTVKETQNIENHNSKSEATSYLFYSKLKGARQTTPKNKDRTQK